MPFQRTRVARFARSGSPLNGRPLGGRYSQRFFVTVGLASVLVACEQRREPSVYELPSTYRGWVLIEWRRPNCPPIPTDGGKLVFRFSASGRICTSSPLSEGWAKDEYYFVGQGRRLPIAVARDDSTVADAGVRIRGSGISGRGQRDVEHFFVGTLDEYRAAPPINDVVKTLAAEPDGALTKTPA